MANFCDRSPCEPLLEALGRYVFGTQTGGYAIAVKPLKGKRKVVIIKYCPFCGGRLERLEMAKTKTVDV